MKTLKLLICLLFSIALVFTGCGDDENATCSDGIKNGTETGIDCGGLDCRACTSPPTCSDGIRNGTETGVDCGGTVCTACPICSDGIQNGSETGIDCGGSICLACPTCTDGIQNGTETALDCGGPSCPACFICGTDIADVEGNIYETVTIGSQCWMKENLKTSKYNDGTPITTGLSNDAWNSFTNGAYAFPDDNAANNATFGKLYNFYAVKTGKLCPTGWHIPTDAEWTILSDFLGGRPVAGGKMKSISPLWDTPNTSASNSSGFTGLPGGYRGGSAVGGYDDINKIGFWWSSTENSFGLSFSRRLYYNNESLSEAESYRDDGYSCRCLKN
jgi:uncharacterized protein (TIGR02145 family)